MIIQDSMVVCFLVCVFLVVYNYGIYPILVYVLAKFFGVNHLPARDEALALPQVSILFAAFNEELVVRETINQALSLDYPENHYEVVVASDGSTDRTVAVLQGIVSHHFRLINYPIRRGKAAVLNDAVKQLTGEIVMFSDANTMIDRLAIRRLVRWFRDPSVGVVVGRLVLCDPVTGRNVDSMYWKYETFMKRSEGKLGCLLGANGAIYAIRKSLYQEIPSGAIIDDFVGPLLVRAQTGCQIIYEPEAVAYEDTPADVSTEFQRRTRIGAGGFQSMVILSQLFNPRQGMIFFSFISHKVLRWLCPFFLVLMLLSNIALLTSGIPIFVYTMIGQVSFYTLATLLYYFPLRLPFMNLLRLSTMFTLMNLALLFGFWRWLRGNQSGAWRPTSRTAPIRVIRQ